MHSSQDANDIVVNRMFEANACTGDGAMIKNWQTNFEGNVVADSSMPRGAWVGSCKCSSSLCRLS